MNLARPHLHVLVLSIAVFMFFWGGRTGLHAAIDFIPAYTGSSCLLHGCNPYDTSQLEQEYYHAGGVAGELPPWNYEIPKYPPAIFLVLCPMTLLRFPEARLLWFLMNGCLFVTSMLLILSLYPGSHRWLATALGSLFLITSKVLLTTGNPAILAISLLTMGSYCFLRSRFLPLGAVLLMLSLAVKPQIGVLIVLYLIAAGIHRRYAVAGASGAMAMLLCAGAILSLHPRSANWIPDLRARIATVEKVGDLNDPRPANKPGTAVLNLQTITSVFLPERWEFDAAAYAIFLILLAAGIRVALRTHASPEIHLISLAALSVLTLLPVFHRNYDGRLMLLSIPAIVIIFQRRRLLGILIGVLTILNTVSIQSRMQQYLVQHGIWKTILGHKFLFILLLRQQTLEMVLLFCLYLFAVYSLRFAGAPAVKPPARKIAYSA